MDQVSFLIIFSVKKVVLILPDDVTIGCLLSSACTTVCRNEDSKKIVGSRRDWMIRSHSKTRESMNSTDKMKATTVVMTNEFNGNLTNDKKY